MLREAIVCILAAGMMMAGCDKGKAPPATQPAPGELVMLTGASFLEPVKTLCEEFTRETGIPVALSSGESEDLLPLVKMARKGDLFVTHDPYLDYVRQANALADHVTVGALAPAVTVQKGNPKGIKSFEDLAKPGLKVALPDPQYSTAGQMVFSLLEKKGIKDAVLKNVDTRLTRGHSKLGTLLKTQVVDAVVMWRAVAGNFADCADVVETPYEYDQEIAVHVMGLSHSKQPEAMKRFMESTRRRGPEIFRQRGYFK